MVHEIRRQTGVPILGTLQGDDIFLEALPEPFRAEALDLIRDHCREMDGFIATSAYYADFMSGYLDIPRERIHVIHPGLNLTGHGAPRPERRRCHLSPSAISPASAPRRACTFWSRPFASFGKCPMRRLAGCTSPAGWARTNGLTWTKIRQAQLKEADLGDHFEHIDCPDHASKVRFLHGIDVLSVPTTYREPKGLYVLEALANGVPVVQPRHGSFPELIEATGGGIARQPRRPGRPGARLAPGPGERRSSAGDGPQGQGSRPSTFPRGEHGPKDDGRVSKLCRAND